MTEQMREQAAALLANYNAFLEQRYVSYITSVGMYQDEQALLNQARDAMVEEWEKAPLEELGNKTPKEWIEEISDLETLIELFVFISANTFDSTPACLISAIAAFGEAGAIALLEKMDLQAAAAYDVDAEDVTEEVTQVVDVTISAVQAFSTSKFGGQAVIEKLLEFLTICNTSNELFLEQISQTLAKRIEETQDAVLAYIQGVPEIGLREEYLLSALSSLPDACKNDAIYKCLRASFLRMSNSAMGAMFLGDYGDPKAIPLLRRFAQQHMGQMPNDDYYAILAVIEKLGGIIDDLLPQ